MPDEGWYEHGYDEKISGTVSGKTSISPEDFEAHPSDYDEKYELRRNGVYRRLSGIKVTYVGHGAETARTYITDGKGGFGFSFDYGKDIEGTLVFTDIDGDTNGSWEDMTIALHRNRDNTNMDIILEAEDNGDQ